jgi:hypothetical protein
MSASKLGKADPFKPVTVKSQTTRINLASNEVRFRKNGIEFSSLEAIPMWHEMTVTLETPFEQKRFEANGVVVSCHGNRHAGYVVSMVFTNLSLPEKARLKLLELSSLA